MSFAYKSKVISNAQTHNNTGKYVTYCNAVLLMMLKITHLKIQLVTSAQNFSLYVSDFAQKVRLQTCALYSVCI